MPIPEQDERKVNIIMAICIVWIFLLIVAVVVGIFTVAAVGFDEKRREKNDDFAAVHIMKPIVQMGNAELYCVDSAVYVVSTQGHVELLWSENGRAMRCEELFKEGEQ